jgi:hypothetical protein
MQLSLPRSGLVGGGEVLFLDRASDGEFCGTVMHTPHYRGVQDRRSPDKQHGQMFQAALAPLGQMVLWAARHDSMITKPDENVGDAIAAVASERGKVVLLGTPQVGRAPMRLDFVADQSIA